MKKRVAFYTLGCKLNFSESSTIGRSFTKAGYDVVSFSDPSDIYVINTCSVTENADKKCRKVVKEALKISPEAFIVVVGCFAQLKPKEISEIKGVDLVLGASEKFQIVDYLNELTKKKQADVFQKNIAESTQFYPSYSLGERTRAFLKVQDGCNYSCTFCTIPQARGASRSASISDILEQAYEIAKMGVKEIILTGVNIGDFGIVEGKRDYSLLELIKELERVDDIERIRISSIEPNLLTDEMISWVANSKKIMPHFHIPLQSGSDKILGLMRRRYQRQLYKDKIELIKRHIKDCCIGVDVIVGFPGETDQDFLDTYHFINELDVSYLHVFTYSERANTMAIQMEGAVPKELRAERSKMLHTLSDKKRRYFYQSYLGENYPVLFESEKKEEFMYGFTSNYVKVKIPYNQQYINELVDVKLSDIDADGVVSALLN